MPAEAGGRRVNFDMPTHWHEDDVGAMTPDELRAYCAADTAYVRERDEFGNTPLLAAAQLGDVAAARVLLEMGADPNAVGDEGFTVLGVALPSKSQAFDSALFDLLLDAGADVNGGSNPPLHLAVSRRNETAVEYLIGRGADPNLRDADGVPPLQGVDAEMRELLLELGADSTMTDGVGRPITAGIRGMA